MTETSPDPGYTNSVPQFAKHMKIEEQISMLGKSRTGIGVGTPARLMDLMENGEIYSVSRTLPGLIVTDMFHLGALSISHLKRIVVDASHVDQKKRGVMDMKDTMIPLARLLSRKELMDRYGSEEAPLDLIFY